MLYQFRKTKASILQDCGYVKHRCSVVEPIVFYSSAAIVSAMLLLYPVAMLDAQR